MMTMTLNFPKYMRMATLGGIAKTYPETSINVEEGVKSSFTSENVQESPANKATSPSVNPLLSYSYLLIPPFFPHTASHAVRRFFYVKNQTAGVCVNPSDAFFLPLNDFRNPPERIRASRNETGAGGKDGRDGRNLIIHRLIEKKETDFTNNKQYEDLYNYRNLIFSM
jgi:hypothetical protein